MARQTFHTDSAHRPPGFSPATRVGNMVFVSGQVGLGKDGKLAGPDAGAQSAQCFRNIEAALKAAGATLDDVTKITTFLVNAEDYPAFATERLKVFPESGPASSTVVVRALVRPEYLVEVEAVAVVG